MKDGESGRRIGDDKQPVSVDLTKLKETKPADYGIRFVFGAAISVIAALISMRFGPSVGGCSWRIRRSCRRP
ncbi:MAG: hypothetical protein ABI401_03355 [Candidatus Dormibacter sp.]